MLNVIIRGSTTNGSITRQRSGQRLPIFEETLAIVRGRWNNARRALAARWNTLVNAGNRR